MLVLGSIDPQKQLTHGLSCWRSYLSQKTYLEAEDQKTKTDMTWTEIFLLEGCLWVTSFTMSRWSSLNFCVLIHLQYLIHWYTFKVEMNLGYLGFHPSFARCLLGGGFKDCWFSSQLGGMNQVDEHIFQNGLVQPPTRLANMRIYTYLHIYHTYIYISFIIFTYIIYIYMNHT